MDRTLIKNLIVYTVAVVIISTAWYLIHTRDKTVMEQLARYRDTSDTLYHSVDSRRIARMFSDSTLPALKRMGLIVSYERTRLETVIKVNGKMWKKRSLFFKESLLKQVAIYNNVGGHPPPLRIIDHKNNRFYAQITSSDTKEVFQ